MSKVLIHIHSGPELKNKATLGMLVALTAFKKGDEVIVPSFCYISPIHMLKILGLVPVPVDIKLEDLQINEDQIEQKINKKTKHLKINQITNPISLVKKRLYILKNKLLSKLSKILHLLKYKNFDQLKINTNGTIVPKESKIDVFQDKRVFFDISDYGKVSRNVKDLVKILKQKKIAHNAARVTEWQDVGKIIKSDRTDKLNKEKDRISILDKKKYL